MTHNGFEIYDIIFEKGKHVGIEATSLVTLPAIESSFLYFGKDNPQFKFVSEEKQELIGAIMIPDKLIFRNIEEGIYVNFTKDVIKDLVSEMIKKGTAGIFTVQHKFYAEPNDVDIQEIWIKESENDKSMDFGIDEPIGTAFMKVKVNSPNLISAIKDNGLNGFSIELDAAIAKKKEVFTKQETKGMTIKDLFSNSVDVNGVSLFFNSELAEKTYLVLEEEGKPVPYSGKFTHNDTEYTVENGVVIEAVNIQLSIDEKFSRLEQSFGDVTTRINEYVAKTKEIEEREAELELLEEQFKKDKLDFEKSKEDRVEIKTTLASQVVKGQAGTKEWLKQFKSK